MSILETPPTALIRAIVRPYGAKLFRKRKADKWAPTGNPYCGGTSYYNRAPYVYSSGYRASGAIEDHEFYRFYGPMGGVSNWATCRVCRVTVWGKQERENHSKRTMCAHYLLEAIKLLRRDQRCVVCDKETSVRPKYGVFLCSDACKNLWMHADTRMDIRANLDAALELAGYVKEAKL